MIRISKLNQQTIKYSIISGVFYASVMALFDYFGSVDFKLWKFIFHLVFFGFFMSFIFRPTLRNKMKNEKNLVEKNKNKNEMPSAYCEKEKTNHND